VGSDSIHCLKNNTAIVFERIAYIETKNKQALKTYEWNTR